MLTKKQKELLLLIRDCVAIEGVPPSFDEMKTALGLKSKSGIHRLITGLEERGFIRRLPHRARALEVLRLPEGLKGGVEEVPKKIKGAAESVVHSMAESLSLPLYGRIAAGTPIEAIGVVSAHINIPPAFLLNSKGFVSGEHYMLEIAGDSMVEAGIMDGDHVIIHRTETAENGSIVVALVDGSEATLKYLERRKGQVALVPANANYEARVFAPDRVKVQGKLVGLIRRY
jgi:repressor LexA